MFVIKRFIIAFILVALVCGGIVGFNLFRDNAIQQFFATMKPPAATVSTTIVKPTDWTPGVEAIGTVSAVRGVDLTVETAGIVKDILFHANQKVEADAVLLQLDDAVERADLEAARAQAALDQTSQARAIELQRRGVGSDVTLDTARATATASASQVTKLQAVLDQKQLTAPFGGTVGIPRIDLGQYLTPGTSVVTLQDLETMRVDFSIPEQQLPLLKIDQTVRLGIGDGEMPFAGTIRGIDPKIDPASRLVTVRAEVANPEGKLTPGQFVQVRVELPEENNVLTVPQTALTSSLYGDFVFVVRPAKPAAANGATPAAAKPEEKPAMDTAKPAAEASAAKPEEKPAAAPAEPTAEEQKPQLVLTQVFVKPGRRNAGLVEILEGIAPGDEVVTAGQNRLSNGMSVAVDNTIDPTKSANQQAAQQ
ncbi:MAG: efflux RND transporter periplasmic adaptor subunit [Mesorhizobium sp.]|nr:efflux RND transporter periplasmic adaptor subunit [Mesorhizobium sp.]TIP11803.1 MAG: efflux RND transporter periplasmic adaptor subunit [Mesorhizobium sp.]